MDRLRSLAIASEAREKMVRSADARSMASAHTKTTRCASFGGKPSAEVTRALGVVARGRVPSPEASDAVSPVARARVARKRSGGTRARRREHVTEASRRCQPERETRKPVARDPAFAPIRA
jgi:hypothetical protein